MAQGIDLRGTLPNYDWDAIELAIATVNGRGSVTDEDTLDKLGINMSPEDAASLNWAIGTLGGIPVLKGLQKQYKDAESLAKRGSLQGQGFVDELRPLFIANDIMQGRIAPFDAGNVKQYFDFQKAADFQKQRIENYKESIPANEKELAKELAKKPFDGTVRATSDMQSPRNIEYLKTNIAQLKSELQNYEALYERDNQNAQKYASTLQKYNISDLTSSTFPGQLQSYLTELSETAPRQEGAGAQFLMGNAQTGTLPNLQFPGNLESFPAADKRALYQNLRSVGYTDAQIRAAADAQFGKQTDEAWNSLTGQGSVIQGNAGTGGIVFPSNITSFSQSQKQAFYQNLKSQGYTDSQIRAAANAQFGVQSDAAWNSLTGRVEDVTTTVRPTGTTLLSTTAAPLTQGAGESRIDPTIAPYLQEGLSVARGLFLNQPGPQLYPEQMYVSPSEQTLAALSAQEAIASSPNAALIGSQGAFLQGLNAPTYGQENFQNLYNFGATQPGLSAYQQAMAGEFSPDVAGLQNVAQEFGNVAAGQFLTGSPYQQQLIEQSTRPITEQFLQQTLPALASQFSQAGRYGSGAQERAIGKASEAAARAVGDIATQIGQQTYTQERGFQEAARGAQANVLGQIAGLQQQGFGNILAGAQGLQGAQAQQFGQQFGAAQALAGAQQQALQTRLGTAAQAPQFYAQQFLPSQALAQVGAQREAIAGQPLQEAITRYNYAQQLPYQQLGGYLSSIYGSPLGSFSAMPQQQGNSFLSNLGAGVNILGTAANLFPQTASQATNWISGLLGG